MNSAPMANPELLPPISPESAPFYEGAARGELRIQRCLETGRLLFPPRVRSPHGAREVPEWITVSGRGTIWSFVIPHPPLLAPFDRLTRYNVILVSLDEDPAIRLVGNLVREIGAQLDEIDPSTLEIGARVRVVFEAVTKEIHLPRWVLEAT